MLTTIKDKGLYLKSELDYRMARWQNAKNLPALTAGDRSIVTALKNDGIYITNLADLGLPSTSQLLNAAHSLLPTMGTENYDKNLQNPPEIFIVTDLPAFANWGSEPRLTNIIHNYIGLPIAYHGVHLRKDFASVDQFATLLWHRDVEDRRVLKIIVYLNDVEEKHGPFEYVPLSHTAIHQLSHYRIHHKIHNSGGIDDETLNQIVPKSAWKSCPGAAGTVILADTRRLLHHGTLRTEERSTLFFVYTANPPKNPRLCTHYWDDTYPRPNLNQAADAVKIGTSIV
ncbi:phytanoyl-CoA dioxygenase family protein [Fortiea contorta]|uniref:phytanoyl-CoA dioxygenase family protein n=1 Tax=Fortiea contorta TaxID=1892405 RepID=UPI000348A05E|nr:phytanoyl-CoA dioxygenase family protein [Fortiea contorta]